MSGADVSVLLNTQYGNLSALLASPQTLWSNRGYDTTNIHAVDNTHRVTPEGNEATFGREVRFQLRKRGGRVHKAWLRITISAGVLNAANRAAWVDDLGANIIQNLKLQYASKDIQTYGGEMLKMYHRLMFHDIEREHYHAMALAGLPPGGQGETLREQRTQQGFQLFVPLSWLFFTRFEDYTLTPEALASNLDLLVQYAPLARLVYSRVIATGAIPAGNPFDTDPAITSTELFQQLIFTPNPEKNAHLSTFETEQGNLYKLLDVEEQRNTVVAAAAGTYSIKINNSRLDAAFIMFSVRDILKDTDWALDPTMTDTANTVIAPGFPQAVNALLPITSLRLLANGRVVVDTCTDVENRAVWRDIYLPGTQVAEPYYFIPFCWLMKDAKNVTSFQVSLFVFFVQAEVTGWFCTTMAFAIFYLATHAFATEICVCIFPQKMTQVNAVVPVAYVAGKVADLSWKLARSYKHCMCGEHRNLRV